jgi:hypothetical protein
LCACASREGWGYLAADPFLLKLRRYLEVVSYKLAKRYKSDVTPFSHHLHSKFDFAKRYKSDVTPFSHHLQSNFDKREGKLHA